MALGSITPNHKVLILLASGFEEVPVVYCLGQMREAGIGVALVGLSGGPVGSTHGLVVKPDCSLEQVPQTVPYKLIILPGDKECVSALVADPRVHRLMSQTVGNDGYVGVMPVAETVLRTGGFITPNNESHFVIQKNGLEVFAQKLVHLAEWE